MSASCGAAGHLRGQSEQRLVGDLGVADDPLQHEVVLAAAADDVELLHAGRALVEETDDVVGRQQRESLPRRGSDVRIFVGHDGEQRPHPVVSLERQQAAGREEAQVPGRVRGPDDRDQVPGLDGGRWVALDQGGQDRALALGQTGAGHRQVAHDLARASRAARSRDHLR